MSRKVRFGGAWVEVDGSGAAGGDVGARPIGQLGDGNNNSLPSSGAADYVPIMVPVEFTANRIGLVVNSVGAGQVDLGVFSDNAGAPGTKLVSTGAISVPGTGQREIIIPATVIPAGPAWIAYANNGNGSSLRFSGVNSASAGLRNPLTGAIVPARRQAVFPLPATAAPTGNGNINWTMWLRKV